MAFVRIHTVNVNTMTSKEKKKQKGCIQVTNDGKKHTVFKLFFWKHNISQSNGMGMGAAMSKDGDSIKSITEISPSK